VGELCQRYGASLRQACSAMVMSRSVYHYRSVAADQTPLRHRIREIAATRVRCGYKRIHVVLRPEGWRINHRRVNRLYKQDGLSLFERRPRRSRSASHRSPPPATTNMNQSWAMDLVSDRLYDGGKLRALKLVDVHTRDCLAIWVDQGIRGDDVVCAHLARWLHHAANQSGSRSTTDPSSRRRRWTVGPRSTVSNRASRGPASRPTKRTSRPSTAGPCTCARRAYNRGIVWPDRNAR